MKPNWTGRRNAERRSCSIKAQVQPYDGTAAIECIVTDFSATGARVEFPYGCEPPNAFDLFMPSRGDTRPAVIGWRTSDAFGLEFRQNRDSTEDQRLTDLVMRVARLEDELRVLRADAAIARGSAPSPEPVPILPVAPPVDDALLARVSTLETRGDEMLRAMRQTLALLGDLRTATVPLAKAS